MLDKNKEIRFFKCFSQFEKDILTGFVNMLTEIKSDIYVVMARKASCLIEALIELGDLTLNGKVYSERILDLNEEYLKEILKDKIVTIIDDTIVSGTTISDVGYKILKLGAKQINIKVVSVNKKWYTPELLKVRLQSNEQYKDKVVIHDFVELSDNDSIKFCYDIVKGLSVIPKLYDYDFPRFKLHKLKESVASSIFENNVDWEYFDCSSSYQIDSNVFSYTCLPNINILKKFDEKLKLNLSQVAMYKIRFLFYKNEKGNIIVTAVPMVIFNSISKDDLEKYLNLIFNSCCDKLSSLFNSSTSKLRLLQYLLSTELLKFWLESYKDIFNNSLGYSIEKIIDKQVEIMLFADDGSKLLENITINSISDYKFKINNTINTLYNKSKFDEIEDENIIKYKIIEPFIDFYDIKEIPCRKAVKDYNYQNFSEEEFQNYIQCKGIEYQRLKNGITFVELCERVKYLNGKYDYIKYTSIVLDKIISKGIAVPIIYEEGKWLHRAYRHGEDAIMGDFHHRLIAWLLNDICNKANVKYIKKIYTEKIISLFLKYGIKNKWIDSVEEDNQLLTDYIIVSNKHDIHGMRTKLNNDGEENNWYTQYLLKKGYINNEEKGYSFNPPLDFDPSEDSKVSSDVNNFSIIFSKFIEKIDKKEIDSDEFQWDLTKLASCIYPKDVLDSLIVELKTFKEIMDYHNKFDYFKLADTNEYKRVKTAVNSGFVKYRAYICREYEFIVSDLSKALKDNLYQNVFSSFFNFEERKSIQEYHAESIEALGISIIILNFAFRLSELCYKLQNKYVSQLINNEYKDIILEYVKQVEIVEIDSPIDEKEIQNKLINEYKVKPVDEVTRKILDVLIYLERIKSIFNNSEISKTLFKTCINILNDAQNGNEGIAVVNECINLLYSWMLYYYERAIWQVKHYNETTQRKLYNSCLYIKLYKSDNSIYNMINELLNEPELKENYYPGIMKLPNNGDDASREFNFIYSDTNDDAKERILNFLNKLLNHHEHVQQIISFVRLSANDSIEVIKNNIDNRPKFFDRKFNEYFAKLTIETNIDEYSFYEITSSEPFLKFDNISKRIEFKNSIQLCNSSCYVYKKAIKNIKNISIGIITILDEEYNAVKKLLLEPFEYDCHKRGAGHIYTIGKVLNSRGHYNYVVLAQCIGMGNNFSSIRAALLLEDFQNLKYVIVSGIAAGAPNPMNSEKHVRLGDVVVSNMEGIIQLDMIKQYDDKTEFRNANINPSSKLLEIIKNFRRDNNCILKSTVLSERPNCDTDILYDQNQNVVEHPFQSFRDPNKPCIFIGRIGSANILLKSGIRRDEYIKHFKIMAFEMEGSGVADAVWNSSAEYLVVRGICDYADQSKNDVWHEYASAVAATTTVEIIKKI